MKKLLFILLTTFLSSGIYAQGNNLQFSQVLNYEYSSVVVSGDNETTVDNLTVPTNKVWKITSGSIRTNIDSYQEKSVLLINQHIVYAVNAGGHYKTLNTPIWLSSGSYSVKFGNRDNNGQILNGSLSIVEFNIVQ